MSKNGVISKTAAKIVQQTLGFIQLTSGIWHPVKSNRKNTLGTILTEALLHKAAKHQNESGIHLSFLSSWSQDRLAAKLHNTIISTKIGEEALLKDIGYGNKSINEGALNTLKNASPEERITLLTAGHIYDFSDEIRQQLRLTSIAHDVTKGLKLRDPQNRITAAVSDVIFEALHDYNITGADNSPPHLVAAIINIFNQTPKGSSGQQHARYHDALRAAAKTEGSELQKALQEKQQPQPPHDQEKKKKALRQQRSRILTQHLPSHSAPIRSAIYRNPLELRAN